MVNFRVEYNNDTGPNDEGFFEYWLVTNDELSFRVDSSQQDADWLAGVLNTQQTAAAVPDGYVPVPVEPTQGMLDAAGMSIVPDGKEWLDQSNRETWAAMLAAAPAQQPAAAVPGYTEDEIADACMMAEVSDSKYVAIIAYLGDNRRAMLAAAERKGGKV